MWGWTGAASLHEHLRTINMLASSLPQYAWLTVLPQLISRICHQNIEVQKATRQIITRVTQAYPQQVSMSHLTTLTIQQPCPGNVGTTVVLRAAAE